MCNQLAKMVYSVEGNIGSGKSTLLSIIKNSMPQVAVVPEPLAHWQKHDLLNYYYSDPKRWAFTFQSYAVLSRMGQLHQILLAQSHGKSTLTERSVVADRQIFAKCLHEAGKMTAMEHSLYLDMFAQMDSIFQTPKVHKFIYLRTNPQMCYERMKKRSRVEETDLPLEYLISIHKLHEEWLRDNQDTLIISGDPEFQSDSIRSQQILAEIHRFIQTSDRPSDQLHAQ